MSKEVGPKLKKKSLGECFSKERSLKLCTSVQEKDE